VDNSVEAVRTDGQKEHGYLTYDKTVKN